MAIAQASHADLLFGDAFDSSESRPKDFAEKPNSDPSIRRPEPRYGTRERQQCVALVIACSDMCVSPVTLTCIPTTINVSNM
jgi:hypothetical protein